MQKKASCLLLAGALLLLTAVPNAHAAAADPAVPLPANSQVITAQPSPSPPPPVVLPDAPNALPDGNKVEFEGHITPQIVSAIVPCSISFHMNPGQEDIIGTNDGGELFLTQVLNPEKATVKNNSIWPFRLSVAQVTTEVPPGAQPIQLVNRFELKEHNEVLLVLGQKEPEVPEQGEAPPHVFDSEEQFLGQALLAEPSEHPLSVLEMGPQDEKDLWVYGKAAQIQQEFSFTVTMTMRIEWIH